VAIACASGSVGASPLNGLVRDPASVFAKDVLVADLVAACPGGRAALAETLHVDAMASDGWSILEYLDRDAVPKAFALTPAPVAVSDTSAQPTDRGPIRVVVSPFADDDGRAFPGHSLETDASGPRPEEQTLAECPIALGRDMTESHRGIRIVSRSPELATRYSTLRMNHRPDSPSAVRCCKPTPRAMSRGWLIMMNRVGWAAGWMTGAWGSKIPTSHCRLGTGDWKLHASCAPPSAVSRPCQMRGASGIFY
jgi:hypothetical protein